MKKLLLGIAIASAFPVTCLAAYGDTTNTDQLDNFYVTGNLGQTQYRTSYQISHRNSVFQNLRFGWRWNGIIGAELGYAYLGRRKDAGDSGESAVNARAATLGLNAKYHFYDRWFLTAHGGYLRSQRTNTRTDYVIDRSGSYTSWNNGWYGGVGLGYDVTAQVSLALNYDNYHLQYGHSDDPFSDKINVAAYSASVEYRF